MRRLAEAVLVTAMAVAVTMAVAMLAATARPAHAIADPADLALSVSGVANSVGPGSTISYRISIINGGPGPAPSTTLSVELPQGTTFTSFTAPADWTAGTPATGDTGKVTASRSTLAPGGTATFTLVLTADPATDGATILLSAHAASTADDLNPQNNTATVTTQVRNAADLALTVTADPDPVGAATALHYTVSLTNAGPAPAARVTLTTTTPAGTAFASFTAPPGWSSTTPPAAGAGVVTSTAESVPVGGPVTFELVVTVLANTGHGAVLDLSPTVSSATPDPAGGNNTATARTSVANAADLAVSMSDDRDLVDPTGAVTYAITLTNNGPAAAASPTLSIGIAAGAAFSSFTAPTGWTVSAPAPGATGTVTATAANLAPTTPAMFTLVLTVTSAGDVSLTATAATSTTDPLRSNDSATETTTVAEAPRTPASASTVGRRGPPLSGTSLVRLAGATAVVVGLGLLSVAGSRARRTRRGYR